MISVGRIDLGLPLDEVMAMCPRQIFELRDRLEALDKPKNTTIELMVAQLIAMVGNTGFRSFEEPLKPLDFMPSRRIVKKKSEPQQKKRRKRADIANEIRMTMMSWLRE